MLGQLHHLGDRHQLRFTRRFPHPPDKVWRAITEPEHLRAWFPAEMVGDRAAGARLRFVFPNGEAPDSEGEIVVYDPPSVLEYTWGEDRLRFELRPDADGTVMTFVTTFSELGKAARDGAGWHECLDVLEHELAGDKPPWDPGNRWDEVHPAYVESFGPEASTIGPPESFQRDD